MTGLLIIFCCISCSHGLDSTVVPIYELRCLFSNCLWLWICGRRWNIWKLIHQCAYNSVVLERFGMNFLRYNVESIHDAWLYLRPKMYLGCELKQHLNRYLVLQNPLLCVFQSGWCSCYTFFFSVNFSYLKNNRTHRPSNLPGNFSCR